MSERLVLWHRWFPPRNEDPDEHPAVASWQRSVSTRFSVAGGELLGAIGGTVVAAFDPSDATDAIDMALDLLDEAEREASLEVAIGAAAGELSEDEGATFGGAIERAQLLVNRAKGGELVLDPRARALAAADFNFGRQVGAGAGAARGTTIDRRHPRRSECAEAIASLASTPLPPIVETVRRDVEEALADRLSRTIVLRGPVGAGATELVGALERALSPGRVLGIGASPGGVVPLASLRLALVRRLGTPARVAEAFEGSSGAVLARVAAGELVPAHELAEAMAAVVRAIATRPWVVLNPLSLIDGATLAALLEARALSADFVLFGRFPVESALPRPLIELAEPVLELTLPPLKTADARVVAEAILGPETPDDVARRVAVLGGDTVLGVVEAARTLIATGDLVRHDGRFTWRMGPRHGANAIGTEELLSERLELLDPRARRVLEALCVIPDGSPLELLAEVATRDSIGENALARSLSRLTREALARGREHPRPASSLLRWRILNLIPPARFMELHRFVGEALAERRPSAPPLEAELGYFLFEGGLEDEARPLLSRTMEALVASGYERAARQLAGWLAQRDEERGIESGRPTPPPPGPELFEEGPPSSEYLLDDLAPLDDADAPTELVARLPLPPPKPRVALSALGGEADSQPAIPAIEASIDDALSDLRDSEVEMGERSLSGFFGAVAPATTTEGSIEVELESLLEEGPEPAHGPIADVDEELDALLEEPMHDSSFADEPTRLSPAPVRPFVSEALRAIRDGDLDGLERAMHRAVAEGSDPGAVGRVRAVAELARGDLDAARRSLREAQSKGRDDRAAQARTHLTEALVELHGGDPIRGVRAGLAALAASRRDADARGEAAAVHTLAACYRALGREDQAQRIEAG